MYDYLSGELYHNYYYFQPVRRESLLPPMPAMCTWKEYFTSPAGQHPALAREMVFKNTTRGFKATVAMVIYYFFFSKELIK